MLTNSLKAWESVTVRMLVNNADRVSCICISVGTVKIAQYGSTHYELKSSNSDGSWIIRRLGKKLPKPEEV